MRNFNILIIFFFSLVLLILSVQFFSVSKGMDANFLKAFLPFVLLLTVVFFLKKENVFDLQKQYLKISNLFVLSFILVHFQIYIDIVLGNNIYFGQDYIVKRNVVNKAIVISTIGLVSFYLGYLIKGLKRVQFKHISPPSISKYFTHNVGYLILLTVLFITFLAVSDLSYFIGGFYGRGSAGTASDIVQGYLLACIFAIVIIQCKRVSNYESLNFFKYIKSFPILFLIIVGIYSILVIISGDRGPIIKIGLIIFGGYIAITKTKLKAYSIGLLLVGGVVVFSTIGVARNLVDRNNYLDKISGVQEVKSSNDYSFSPKTMELAGVVRTLHISMDYTEKEDFTYGKFQLRQILASFPVVGNLFLQFFDYEDYEASSAAFVTYQHFGRFPPFGLGITCVADVYLDFGYLGVLVVFFLFGYFIRDLDVLFYRIDSSNLYLWTLSLVFLGSSIYLGRSALLIPFRDFVNVMIMIYVGSFINRIFVK